MTVRTPSRCRLRVEQLETRAAPAAVALSQLASPAVPQAQAMTAVKEPVGTQQPAGIIAILIG